MSVIVQYDDFNVAEEYQALCQATPKAGAVVFFVGKVREVYRNSPSAPKVNTDSISAEQPNSAEQGLVDYLELYHYPGLTESLCSQIIEDAKSRFSIDGIRVIHRVGRLKAKDQIVFVAVAAGHRQSAFSAAQYVMDYLKSEAAFWKKEVGGNGATWVAVSREDRAAIQSWHSGAS